MTSSESTAFLGTVVGTLQFFGFASDLETPSLIAGSFDLSTSDGQITLDPLVGPQGIPGGPANPIQFQFGVHFTSVDQLPDNLENIPLDIGKTFWVGNNVFVWGGTTFFVKQMGVPGIPGPVPQITADVVIVDPDTSITQVVQSGTALDPGLEFQLAIPPGPPGPAAPIEDAFDFDNSVEPLAGDVLMFNGSQWEPNSLDLVIPQVFSLPEGSFVSQELDLTIGDDPVFIGFLSIPPQPFPWKPIVWGHILATGIDVTLTVGVEVILGAQTAPPGQLVGRGFGNIGNYANIMPHFSSPSATSTAVTTGNSVDFVPANHTGDEGTLFVSLVNDGPLGLLSYSNTNSQLFCMVVPVGGVVEVGS
jgi:hypothetical protein